MNINGFLPFTVKMWNKIGLFCVIDSLHKNFQMQLFNPLEGCHYAYLAERHTTITDQTQRAVLFLLLVMVVGIATSVLDSEWYAENIDYQIISPSTQCQSINAFIMLCNNWSQHFLLLFLIEVKIIFIL